MNENNRFKIVFYGFLFLFSLSFITLSFFTYYDYKDKLLVSNSGVTTTAKVTNIIKNDHGKYPSYNFEFEYLHDSIAIRSIYREGLSYDHFHLDQEVKIIFEKSDPSNFFIISENILKKELLLGTGILVMILLMLIFRKRIFKYRLDS